MWWENELLAFLILCCLLLTIFCQGDVFGLRVFVFCPSISFRTCGAFSGASLSVRFPEAQHRKGTDLENENENYGNLFEYITPFQKLVPMHGSLISSCF